MTTTPPDVKSIFGRALEIESPAARAAYLEEACGTNAGLRADIEGLLRYHCKAGEFLGRPPAADATEDYETITERPGTVIGPYKLMEQIGEGGMGLVFVAEQQHPVRRKVALKIIKPGMDTREVMARFEAERQALALMDHPNIARVFDAGATESGRPYFVMELVKGIPIVDYCDQQQLTARERLDLFLSVCQAVQHAHGKGIIHRDLKPSNILVAPHDGEPVVKVIDFGVAKAIGQQLTDKTVYTRFAQMIGTPLYMSPEQAEINALDVDIRSDVYSLGVLLYELLTGTTPFDRKRFATAAYDEIRRIIKEEEPPRPSTRLSTLGETLTTVSARRNTPPAKLSAMVRGDLDWIVMKALEKDRQRRYETAGSFAADVRRFLADEPIEARPPSAWYRFRKLTRRHKVALTTTGIVAAALILGTVLSTWQAVRATWAERMAKQSELEANRQRLAAEEAKQQALEAKTEADKQRDEARLTAYASGMGLAQRAWEENNAVRARELLAEVPREAAGRNLRGFEWNYLSRLTHPDELTLVGHAWWVMSVAFSPDGQRLASASYDKTVKIWDTATGKELLALKGHAHGVTSVAFSPDGQRLASRSYDKTVKIWDSATGKELLDLKGHAGDVSSVAFSPDGQRLASASGDQTVKIWDSATGKELFTLKGHANYVMSVAFSPDGQRLATGSIDQTVRIWDSVTGKELLALKGHADAVWSVAFSPDGQRLATGSSDGSIHLWETTSVSPELKHRRATNQMVADLFGEMHLRVEVLERLRTLPGMSPSRRQEVLAAAQTYSENPYQLSKLAWELVKLPGGEISGYRKALRYSEEACQVEPENGDLLNTLGVACYRVGNYEKALGVLSRSDKINALRFKGSHPSDLAFLAMAHNQLGHAKEAEAHLQLLRERIKDPRFAQNSAAHGLFHEAEELLAKPKPPSSK